MEHTKPKITRENRKRKPRHQKQEHERRDQGDQALRGGPTARLMGSSLSVTTAPARSPSFGARYSLRSLTLRSRSSRARCSTSACFMSRSSSFSCSDPASLHDCDAARSGLEKTGSSFTRFTATSAVLSRLRSRLFRLLPEKSRLGGNASSGSKSGCSIGSLEAASTSAGRLYSGFANVAFWPRL